MVFAVAQHLVESGRRIPVGGVEGSERGGGNDLDGGDEQRGCAEGFELGGEVGGLVAGSGYQDAFVLEGKHLDGF